MGECAQQHKEIWSSLVWCKMNSDLWRSFNIGNVGEIAYGIPPTRREHGKQNQSWWWTIFQYIKNIIYIKLHFRATYALTFGFLEMLAWRGSVTETVVPTFWLQSLFQTRCHMLNYVNRNNRVWYDKAFDQLIWCLWMIQTNHIISNYYSRILWILIFHYLNEK